MRRLITADGQTGLLPQAVKEGVKKTLFENTAGIYGTIRWKDQHHSMKYKSRYLFVVGFLSFVFVTRGRETCEMIDADCVHTHAACVSGQLWHLPRVQPEVFLITFTTTCTVAPTPGTTLHYTHTHTGLSPWVENTGQRCANGKKSYKKKGFLCLRYWYEWKTKSEGLNQKLLFFWWAWCWGYLFFMYTFLHLLYLVSLKTVNYI